MFENKGTTWGGSSLSPHENVLQGGLLEAEPWQVGLSLGRYFAST